MAEPDEDNEAFYDRLREQGNLHNFAAKYPFLAAKKVMRDERVNLKMVLEPDLFKDEKRMALLRILDGIPLSKEARKDLPTDIGTRYNKGFSDGIASREDEIHNVLSYVIARMLASCYPDPMLINYYCRKEAIRAGRHLGDESGEIIGNIAKQFGLRLNVSMSQEFGPEKRIECKIHMIDYLKKGGELLKNPRFRLKNHVIKNGYLTLTQKKASRFLVEVIDNHIHQGLPAPVNEDIIENLAPYIRDIKTVLDVHKKHSMVEAEVTPSRTPPCMRDLKEKMGEGVNISHFARLALATFYIKLNFTEDNILAIFSAAPDFKEDKTRYQIRHLMGEVGSKGYDPPGCSSMITNGLCKPDKLCNKGKISHPLNYYKVKARLEKTLLKEKKERGEGYLEEIEDISKHVKKSNKYFRYWGMDRISDLIGPILQNLRLEEETSEPSNKKDRRSTQRQ